MVSPEQMKLRGCSIRKTGRFESKEEEMMGKGIGESETEELVPE